MVFYKSACTYCNNGGSCLFCGFGFTVCFIKVYAVTVIVLGIFKNITFRKYPKMRFCGEVKNRALFLLPRFWEEGSVGGGVAVALIYFSERISAIFSSVNFSNAVRAFSVMSMNSPFSAKNSRQRILLVSPDVNKSAATFW